MARDCELTSPLAALQSTSPDINPAVMMATVQPVDLMLDSSRNLHGTLACCGPRDLTCIKGPLDARPKCALVERRLEEAMQLLVRRPLAPSDGLRSPMKVSERATGSTATPNDFFGRTRFGRRLSVWAKFGVCVVRAKFRFEGASPGVYPNALPRSRSCAARVVGCLGRTGTSPRWKQIVCNSRGHHMHRLEITTSAKVDDDVVCWLRQAYDLAA